MESISFFRVRHWPSSSEPRPTWSAQPSRQKRASRAFSVPQLWPASTSSTLPTNPARSAASLRDCYTCPARPTSSPPPSARTSPKAAPSCDGSSGHAGERKEVTRGLCCRRPGRRGGREQQRGPCFLLRPPLSPVSPALSAQREKI